IGFVGDFESLRVLLWRAHDRDISEVIFVGELEVTLVVRRAAEDRAGAIVHHDEIGDVDWELPGRIEGMDRFDPSIEALLFSRLNRLLGRAPPHALCKEYGEVITRERGSSCDGKWVIRRDRHEFGAE